MATRGVCALSLAQDCVHITAGLQPGLGGSSHAGHVRGELSVRLPAGQPQIKFSHFANPTLLPQLTKHSPQRMRTIRHMAAVQAARNAADPTASVSLSLEQTNDVEEREGDGNSPDGAMAGGGSQGLTSTVVGVLGGGQLGRMLCQAASPLAIKVAVLDPLPDAPAGPIAFRHMVGSFRDRTAVTKFAKGCGVITMEIEHVDVPSLEALEADGVDVEPKASTIAVIQDKYAQKIHFRKHGVPLPDFIALDSMESAQKAGETFGFPLMVKSRRFAYDGRGNAVARNAEDLPRAIAALGGVEHGLYAEKWAPFVKELAIMVARGKDGTLSSYPVVETTHRDNICHTVEAPAVIPPEVAGAAMKIAETAIGSLQGAGVFGVELFLLPDNTVLLNEVAPRPHNSGHYTIEACCTSQYEQHLRAVLGLPLGDPSMKVPAAAMVNILGEADGEEGFALAQELMQRAVAVPGASIHWYDKPEIRAQRKMGHITVVGPSTEVVRERIAQIRTGTRQVAAPKPATAAAAQATEGASMPSWKGKPPLVGVIMGSDSDLKVMKDAAQVLEEFEIPHEVTVVSAHRTPQRMVEYAQGAHKRGVQVIIAGAGGAAHLPGMVASMTPLPVIGVPVRASSLDGLDSLLSIVQMPRGVPVATVAINNATNAALLAVRILASSQPPLLEKMVTYQRDMESQVITKAQKLEQVGWASYQL